MTYLELIRAESSPKYLAFSLPGLYGRMHLLGHQRWVSMEGHSGQKCNLIATCIPLDRIRVPLDHTFLPLDRTFPPFHRTFLPLDRTFLPFDRTFIPFDHTFLPFDCTFLPFNRTSYFNYFGLFLCGISHLSVPPWKQHSIRL